MGNMLKVNIPIGFYKRLFEMHPLFRIVVLSLKFLLCFANFAPL